MTPRLPPARAAVIAGLAGLAGLACFAATLCAGPASAHDFWLEPSTFRPRPGAAVAVHLRIGQDFVGDPVRRVSRNIEQFFIRQDGDDEPIGGADNIDPAGFLRADGEATAVIGYRSAGSSIELPADRFEAHLRQYGLDAVVAERIRRGEQDKPGRERFYRYAKALLAGARASAAVTQPLGFAYEIVPVDDPTRTSGTFRGRVLHDGKPLAGALVEAFWRDDRSVHLSALSNAQGAFAFALPRPGVWLIKSVHMVRAGFFSSADWDSLWATLTFETPTTEPGPGP